MEKRFKLKKEARIFFDKSMAENIYTIEVWKKNFVHENLLEEVPNVYVVYGHPTKNGADLGGYTGNEKASHHYFTIHVNDMSYKDHDNVNIPDIMDKIQSVLDSYFKKKFVD